MENMAISPWQPHPREDVQEELVGNQLFLHRADGDPAVHCLNSSAAVIWLLCDGIHDLAGIAREVSVAYKIPEPDALADARTALAQLCTLGLLEPGAAVVSHEPIERSAC